MCSIFSSVGKNNGIVSTIIANESITHPRGIYNPNTIPRTTYLLTSSPVIQSAANMGRPVIDKKMLKIIAPMSIVNIMPVVMPVSTRVERKLCLVRRRLLIINRKLPRVPMAAASVGVAIPRYMPPIIMIKIASIGHTWNKDDNRSLIEKRGAGAPAFGSKVQMTYMTTQ